MSEIIPGESCVVFFVVENTHIFYYVQIMAQISFSNAIQNKKIYMSPCFVIFSKLYFAKGERWICISPSAMFSEKLIYE